MGSTPSDRFAEALRRYGVGELAAAAALAREAAAAAPERRVFQAGVRYLERARAGEPVGVYSQGDAFRAFARSGGNVALYRAVSAALEREHADAPAGFRLLDVGVGDGMALLGTSLQRVGEVDLIEPSDALLSRTRGALEARGARHRALVGTLADAAAHPGWQRDRFDVAEATFSLQSIPPPERRTGLRWLAERVRRLLVVEFDVPSLAADHVLARYERGLAEYDTDPHGVVQGFLMPVLFGLFGPDAARTNFEQPIRAWSDELAHAGFSAVTVRHLHAYWWADACLITADGARSPDGRGAT